MEYYDNNVFATNLRRLLKENGKKSVDLVNYLGVSKAVVSEWLNAKKLPRMDKVDRMCVFFNCNRSDLIAKKEPDAATSDPQSEMILKLIARLSPEQKTQAFDFLLSLIANSQ